LRAARLALPVFFIATWVGCGGCEALTGAKHQVRLQLRQLAEQPLVDKEQGLELALSFMISSIEVEGDEAYALVRADVDGLYQGVKTACVCVERVPFFRDPGDGSWKIKGFPLPRLASVVQVLEARRAAFEQHDAARYLQLLSPNYPQREDARPIRERVERLFQGLGETRQVITERILRVESRRSVVTESYRLSERAKAGGGTTAHEGRSRQELRRTPDGWRFVSGLL